MDKKTKLAILYAKILDNGDKFLSLDRVMENFYFKYDISKQYTLEDLNEMLNVLRKWKKNFEAYNRIAEGYLNELEEPVSSDEHKTDGEEDSK